MVKQNRLGQFTAAAAVDMRPGIYGLDIIVRYVTRASDRFEVRNRLYQRVIDLLHNPVTPPQATVRSVICPGRFQPPRVTNF